MWRHSSDTPFLGILSMSCLCTPPLLGTCSGQRPLWQLFFFFFFFYYCCDHILALFWRKAQIIIYHNLRHFFSLPLQCKSAKEANSTAHRLLCGEGRGFSFDDYQPSSIPGSGSPSCRSIMRQFGFLAMCKVSTGLCRSENEEAKVSSPFCLPPS